MAEEPKALDERDHRKLGPALDLFSFSEHSPGSAFWHPKGMVVYGELVAYIRREWRRRGYDEVRAPQLLSSELCRLSGHDEAYRQNMFFSGSEGRDFAVKPMNCPGHCVMFSERQRSWRDLPLRYAEVTPLHRNEFSGALNGLKRVRSFSQDDAHIFCREDQVRDELVGALSFVRDVYRVLGFGEFRVELSSRPKVSVGSDESWAKAERILRDVLSSEGVAFSDNPGDGAFYGPKIDFHVLDGLGRSWQCGTAQLDFVLPERFGLRYRDQENGFSRPVMVHRAVLGSFERVIAILLEQWGGAFPAWLAPEQARVLPVDGRHEPWARQVREVLVAADLRASVDASPEKLGRRVLDAAAAKIPYVLVVGDREAASGDVSVRARGAPPGSRPETVPLGAFVSRLSAEVASRVGP